MAATPKKPQVIKMDFYIDKDVYDEMIRICVKTSYAPKVVVERLIRKFNESGGQI